MDGVNAGLAFGLLVAIGWALWELVEGAKAQRAAKSLGFCCQQREQDYRDLAYRLADMEVDRDEQQEAAVRANLKLRLQASQLRELRQANGLLAQRREEAECQAEHWLEERNRLLLAHAGERGRLEGALGRIAAEIESVSRGTAIASTKGA